MRRSLIFVVILAFSSLQLYQLCDASEDMLEDLQAVSQISRDRLSLTQVPAPDDDPDVNIPSLFDRSLTTPPISFYTEWTIVTWLPVGLVLFQAPAPMISRAYDLSPPGPYIVLYAISSLPRSARRVVFLPFDVSRLFSLQ